MNAITIREERPEEFSAIYQLVKEAFATARVSDGDEQNFVDRLRAGGAYIPELALVAEENSSLAGHIMLTTTRLSLEEASPQESPFPALLLAPLCVRLRSRCHGVGSALVHQAFAKAILLGFRAVFLVGDVNYYGTFGFRQASEFDIRHALQSVPDQYVLACELIPNALRGKRGVIYIE